MKSLLQNRLHDTTRAEILYQLAKEYWDDFPSTSLDLANQTLSISQGCGYKHGIGNAYRIMAGVYGDNKSFYQAIEFYKKELVIRQEEADYQRVADVNYALGDMYSSASDLNESLRYYTDAIAPYEKIGGKRDIAGLYNNIAKIYKEIGQDEQALKYYKMALKINEDVGNKEWSGINLLNIGAYYATQGQVERALQYFESALKIFQEIGSTVNVANSKIKIGSALTLLGEYGRAERSILEGLEILRKMKQANLLWYPYYALGKCYTSKRNFKLAKCYLDSSLSISSKNWTSADQWRRTYEALYQFDSASGNTKDAFIHYKLFVSLNDSIRNGENAQKAKQQGLRKEFEFKESALKAEQLRRDSEQSILRNAILAGLVGSFVFLFIVYRQRNRIKSVNTKNEELLFNILPVEVADELKSQGRAVARHYDNVSVMFTDFKSFTTLSERLSPQELVDELDACFKAFDEITGRYNVEKIKTIGDAYLAVCGLPMANSKHAENIVHAAIEIRDFMLARKQALGDRTFEVRIGINSGRVIAGIVGLKKFAYDIWGDAVNVAARMEQSSEAGKINVSESTYELVRHTFDCEYRGELEAKNKGVLKMFYVNGILNN